MGQRSLSVSLSKGVLKWARESAGLGTDAAARKLRTSPETVARWEAGRAQPTLRSVQELAALYKRPLAAFFLPAPPEEPPPPHDFRAPPGVTGRPLSTKMRIAIREARWLQSRARELQQELGLPPKPKIQKASPQLNAETWAATERQALGVSLEQQKQWREPKEALSAWRRAIESLNILVFQMRMPEDEVSGFSLTDDLPYAIVLNASERSEHRRIFTLLHEYGHVLLGSSSVCMPDEAHWMGTHALNAEVQCNRFAGHLLVPRDALTNTLRPGIRPLAQLDDLVAAFKVSKGAILCRLRAAGIIDEATYQAGLAALPPPPEPAPPGPRRVSLPRRCLRERGTVFADLVLQAQARDVITYCDAAEYLAVRAKNVEEVRSLLTEAR